MIDCPTDCRIGPSGPNVNDYLGLAGDPYGAGAPPPPNGTVSAHTMILGVNYANCTFDSAKAHVNGGYGVGAVFNLRGASYVDIACFDITDHSSCGRQGQVNGCNSSYPLSDYASNGIVTNNSTTNTTITDVRIHGMASAGMLGATGTGVSLLRVALVGNASSGWNMDDGSGATGTGTLSLNYFSVLWNGCAEEYPIVDSLPYQDCTDDNDAGYGDGIGTATVTSSPAWLMTITNSIAAFNTQDGFDLLHLQGGGSSLTITQSLAYSNMGQQLKVGSASTARNNLLIGNCNALRQPITGTPSGYNSRLSDFCRAADTAVVVDVQDSMPTYFQFNTLYSANATGLEIDCNGICTELSTIAYEDNIFLGFMNNKADGYPGGGKGEYANPVYLSVPGLFSNSGSTFSHNATYHTNPNWTCPATHVDETDAICDDPQLTDETWHLYGYGDMSPIQDSRVIGMGIAIPGVTVDYNGEPRPDTPSIGALEYGSTPSGEIITVNATPNPAASGQSIILTATVAQTGSAVPTGSVNFLNGSASLGSASLDSTGAATLIVSGLPAGSYEVAAVYSGDANYPPGESGLISLPVLFATATSLVASPNPVIFDQALTLTATVQGSGTAALTGWVTFLNGSTVLGVATIDISGIAILSTSSLAAGSYRLTAQFAGNGNYLASTSAGVSIEVNAQATKISLAASSNPVTFGQTLVVTATVQGSGVTAPAGTVAFYDGAIQLGTDTLNAGGAATLTTSSLAAGSHSISASYMGDSNFTSSTSSVLNEVVEDSKVVEDSNLSISAISGGDGTNSATAPPGGTAVFKLTVSPVGSTAFTTAVIFSVSGLPPGATCTFSPGTLAAGLGTSNVTFTVNLAGQSATFSDPIQLSKGRLPLALGLMLLPFASRLRRVARRLNRPVINRTICLAVLGFAGMAAFAGLTGCGEITSGARLEILPQSYSLTITATSGLASNSTAVNLTVQ